MQSRSTLVGVITLALLSLCAKPVLAEKISLKSLEKTTVFTAGADGINTYRIPSVVVAKDGSILVFCEARKKGWKDHRNTAVVMKRSTDSGKTWSKMITIASDNYVGAYVDPCPVVDYETGEIFVLMAYAKPDNRQAVAHTAWLVSSTDNGLTWSDLKDVSKTMVTPGYALQGVGVGSGIQIKKGAHKGRLVIPTRQIDIETVKGRDIAVFSDDHGKSWQNGNPTPKGCGEHQIAELSNGDLMLNQRGSKRWISTSQDGGSSWGEVVGDEMLPVVTRGCQASIASCGDYLLFTSPTGGSYSETIDDRCGLTIYRSLNDGKTWRNSQLLHKNAAGYSCIGVLPDNRVCVVFESGDSYGFIRTAARRPAGWMRIDMIMIPSQIANKKCWFGK